MNALAQPKEYKVVALRECPTPMELQSCDCPSKAAEYWNRNVITASYFNPDCECFVVVMLNTKNRVKGHYLVSFGTVNASLVHAREVFRAAIIAGSTSVLLMHNHPSGDPTPSSEDVRITKQLVQAGKILGIEVMDHVIVGYDKHVSLKELGLL